MRRYIMMLLCMCVGGGFLHSQERQGNEICIDFPHSVSKINPSYMSNASRLESIIYTVDSIMKDTSAVVVYAYFAGAASPEGHAALNKRLSRERLTELENYVRSRIEIPDSIIQRNDQYIPWTTLISMVENDDIENKAKILSILRQDEKDTFDMVGRSIDARVNELAKLSSWETMKQRYFVHMRKACMLIVTEHKKQEVKEAVISGDTIKKDTVTVAPVMTIEEKEPAKQAEIPHTPRYLSLKTNAVYAAALIFNGGAEIQLSRHLTLDVMGVYSPYDLFSFDRKIRTWGVQPELRYWWGDTPMVKGHFVGLHTHVCGFNVQLNDRYRYQDPNHALWGMGVSYGYALPLGKNDRWALELVAGVGYAQIKYDTYEGSGSVQYIGTDTKDYWGLTRLGVNFTYRFDLNKNKKQSR